MREQRVTPGHVLAAAGGAGLAISLWLPWYTIHFSQAALNSVAEMSQRFGALGGLIRSGTALLSQLGPFHVTAWQVFKTTPAVLLGVAIIGGGLALLALTDRAGNTSQLTMLAGLLGTLLVGYRIAVPPGQGNFVQPAWASYLALLSALGILAGGFLGNRAQGPVPNLVAPIPGPAPAPTPAAAAYAAHVDPFAYQPAAAPAAVTPAETWSAPGSVPPPAV